MAKLAKARPEGIKPPDCAIAGPVVIGMAFAAEAPHRDASASFHPIPDTQVGWQDALFLSNPPLRISKRAIIKLRSSVLDQLERVQ